MPGGWKAKKLSSDPPPGFQASKLYSLTVYPNSSLNSASSITVTPSSLAFASLDPGDSPATTKSVLRLTDPLTLPPAAVIISFAWRLVIPPRVPVSTKILPSYCPDFFRSAKTICTPLFKDRLDGAQVVFLPEKAGNARGYHRTDALDLCQVLLRTTCQFIKAFKLFRQ